MEGVRQVVGHDLTDLWLKGYVFFAQEEDDRGTPIVVGGHWGVEAELVAACADEGGIVGEAGEVGFEDWAHCFGVEEAAELEAGDEGGLGHDLGVTTDDDDSAESSVVLSSYLRVAHETLELVDVGADDVEAGAPEGGGADVYAEARGEGGRIVQACGGEEVVVVRLKASGPGGTGRRGRGRRGGRTYRGSCRTRGRRGSSGASPPTCRGGACLVEAVAVGLSLGVEHESAELVNGQLALAALLEDAALEEEPAGYVNYHLAGVL